MKVLLASEYWQPKVLGGGEISAHLLARNLAKEGVDVSVLTSRFKGLPRYEVLEGVKVYRNLSTGTDPSSFLSNIRRMLSFTRSVERELPLLDKKEDYDIIHAMNVTSLAGVAAVKEKISKPLVAHVNSPTPFCPRGILLKGDSGCGGGCDLPAFRQCVKEFGTISKMSLPFYLRKNPLFLNFVYKNFMRKKEALKKFDFFLPISSFMKNLLLGEGISEEKIKVIANIVETERFFKIEKRTHNVPRILYLGPYTEFKGPQVLLQALVLTDLGYECSLHGSGYLEERLKEIVREKKLNVEIKKPVPYDTVPSVYSEHDIVVFPSLVSEAFGRVAIEASAAGKPVIASNIGGVMDIVEDGLNGLLVKPGDAGALKDALGKLLSDPALRDRMGAEGRRIVRERFSAGEITSEVLSVYARLA